MPYTFLPTWVIFVLEELPSTAHTTPITIVLFKHRKK